MLKKIKVSLFQKRSWSQIHKSYVSRYYINVNGKRMEFKRHPYLPNYELGKAAYLGVVETLKLIGYRVVDEREGNNLAWTHLELK